MAKAAVERLDHGESTRSGDTTASGTVERVGGAVRIGPIKLSTIRQELRRAWDATGDDPIRWLEQRMTASEMTITGGIFKEKKFGEKCWTHNFSELIDYAGLTRKLGNDTGANPVLLGFWGVVKDWSEAFRYQKKDENEARELYEAITNDPDGVFQWIQKHW